MCACLFLCPLMLTSLQILPCMETGACIDAHSLGANTVSLHFALTFASLHTNSDKKTTNFDWIKLGFLKLILIHINT